MTDPNQAGSTESKNRPKAKAAALTAEQINEQVGLVQLPAEPDYSAATDNQAILQRFLLSTTSRLRGASVETHATRLSDPRLQTAQRQALATEIGRLHGNRYLQRVAMRLKGETKPVGYDPQVIPLQRAETETHTPPQPISSPTTSLIVDDSVEQLEPGQMKKSEFLAQLRSAVMNTAEEALAGTDRSAQDCPYIGPAFEYYSTQTSEHLERALRKYAPEAAGATTARDYIPFVCTRVRQGIATWATTGEITNIPEEIPFSLPGLSVMGLIGQAASALGSILFKRREGQPRRDGDPQVIQAQLGPGRPLNSEVKSRMGSVFGHDFSHVRVHTDARASALATSLNARAFTLGEHVTFGAGEYQPGSLAGDALIAHELAHVVQQKNAAAANTVMPKGETEDNALEKDADLSAVGAMIALWGKTKGTLVNIAQNVTPGLTSGLRLQRCSSKSRQLTLEANIQQMLNATPVDYNGLIAAIHAAPVAERQAVLSNSSLRDLITNQLSAERATIIMSSLLEGSQTWVNPPSNDFFNYFVVNKGKGTLPNTASMNCWESILYAAYLAHKIDANWIVQFYTNALNTPDPNAAIWALLQFSTSLPQYPAQAPRAGQLLFYHTGGPVPGHVALSLGGDEAMSLWNQPNNDRAVQRIRVTDLSGTIYIGNAPW